MMEVDLELSLSRFLQRLLKKTEAAITRNDLPKAIAYADDFKRVLEIMLGSAAKHDTKCESPST